MENWPKSDEARRKWCLSKGIRVEHHCCLDMAFAISDPVLTPHQGPSRVIDWIASVNEYRIPVPYDGYSSTLMRFCPWCGSRLGCSRQEEWYEALYRLGYCDPGEEDIPPQFESDEWWRGHA